MYVFGGRDTVGNSNELGEFHFKSLEWHSSNADGECRVECGIWSLFVSKPY